MLSMTGIRFPPAKKMMCLSLFNLLEHSRLEAVPTKAIYESVGIAPNSFYYHFRDKYDCASYVFRIILFQSMGGNFSSPERIFEDISDMVAIYREFEAIRKESVSADTSMEAPYSLWVEKWKEGWFSMAMYVRKHARVPFMNIYNCREANSPYYELREAWDKYFSYIQAGLRFMDDKRRDFFKEALFSFWELYVFKFALNPDCNFQPDDAELLTYIRKNLIGTVEKL